MIAGASLRFLNWDESLAFISAFQTRKISVDFTYRKPFVYCHILVVIKDWSDGFLTNPIQDEPFLVCSLMLFHIFHNDETLQLCRA